MVLLSRHFPRIPLLFIQATGWSKSESCEMHVTS